MLRQIPAANHPDSRPTTRPKSFRFKMSWQWSVGKHSGLILKNYWTHCPILVPDSFLSRCWNVFRLAAWCKSQQLRFAKVNRSDLLFVCLGQTLLMKILQTSIPSICACSKKSKDLLTLFTLQGVGWEMTVIRGRVVHSHKEQRGILKLHFLSSERDCLICESKYWWQTLNDNFERERKSLCSFCSDISLCDGDDGDSSSASEIMMMIYGDINDGTDAHGPWSQIILEKRK